MSPLIFQSDSEISSGRISAALASAPSEEELISPAEIATVTEAWQDIELGLIQPDELCVRTRELYLLTTELWCRHAVSEQHWLIEWTRAADIQRMVAMRADAQVTDALHLFTSTAQGHVTSLPEDGEYRLHVGAWRVRFVIRASHIQVLGLFPGPSGGLASRAAPIIE